jgi:hypothetical protein
MFEQLLPLDQQNSPLEQCLFLLQSPARASGARPRRRMSGARMAWLLLALLA